MPDAVDARVIGAARAGDGHAFEQIFRTLGPAVHGYLAGHGLTDAEDAVNDVFLRVHQALPRFEGEPHRFRSWVFVIAHHLVIDRRRFSARQGEHVPLDSVDDWAGGDVEMDALTRVANGHLHSVLHQLSPDQRDVILLRFLADLSVEDAAAALGRPVTAVKALQHRAIAALRRILDVPVSESAPASLTGT